ncbi:MAG: phosphoribosylaminoimidazolesuccinocarboxamide synthase [Phycisphaerales bacterium]|nr:phosphoribosylaminoimidazolesuccinocarboxamide synthase [Phycisphaerales bacterium]
MTATHSAAVYQTDLPLPGRRQGKVRDIYEVPAAVGGRPSLLIIASDRISAFDVVLPTPIPGKGRALTRISTEWFNWVRPRNIIADHLISTNPEDVPGLDESHYPSIEGRMTLGRAAQVVPVECVVRGYITGSGWKEYQRDGSVCGIKLPAGLQQCDQLPEPIFTPATKATEGHDENIDFETACTIAGTDVMTRLRDISMEIYTQAVEYAKPRGLMLADTKFEFGFALDEKGQPTDELLLVDEILTPDSSRYWPAEDYEPGRDQESFDKQYVRNWLQEICDRNEWDKTPPGPALPEDVIRNSLDRYDEAGQRLFG